MYREKPFMTAIQRVAGLVFLAAFFIIPQTVAAQVSCGDIIIPANQYTGQAEQRTPVENCTDPFEVTFDVANPYQVVVNGNVVPDGGTTLVPGGRTESVAIQGTSYMSGQNVDYYKHEGPDYVRVRTNYDLIVPEADLLKYADTYFGDLEVRAFYKEIVSSNDPFSYFENEDGSPRYDSEGELVEDRYDNFVSDAAAYIQIPFVPGTYTAVITEYLVVETYRSIWDTIFDSLVPTAYANHEDNGWPPRYVFTRTFTIAAEPEVPVGASSVLFLPGIQASRLYKDGLVGTEDEVWVPNGNQDVQQLAMDSAGVSQNSLYTRDIMSTLPVAGTVYDSFARSMVNLVDEGVIKSWTPFAYDWRLSVDAVSRNGTLYEEGVRDIVAEVEYLAQNSFTNKVTIIGHSNGGLLAKAVMKRLERDGKSSLVDKVVLLASPQLGTPKAIGTILHGYDQEKLGGWLIDDAVARDVIQNMPGAYGLVTSKRYLDTSPDKIIKFEASTATEMFRSVYGDSIDTEEELRSFLTGSADGRNQATTIDEALKVNAALLDSQINLHNNELDNWTAPAGVEVVEIVGTGLNTVSGFEYRSFSERVCSVLGTLFCETKNFYKPVPMISQSGDKTVMTLSAEAYNANKQVYFIDLESSDIRGGQFKVEHYNISENPSIHKLLKNILLATTTEIEFISNTNSYNARSSIMFGVHSPADIELVDLEGNRVGRTNVNGVLGKEEEITGSSYFEIGTSKYIIVPETEVYRLKLKGTGEGGLTFTTDRLVGQTQTPIVSVAVATVTPSTTVQINYTSNELSNLEIDTNGDTFVDTILTPQGEDVTPKTTYKNLKTRINSLTLSTVRKLPLILLAETAEILDKKSVVNPKFSQAEALALKQLEALVVTYQKKGWISKKDAEELKVIINKLK